MDTTKLDDLLNQAEAQESEQNQWIEDINYITKNFYVDEHGVVEVKNKIIGDMSKHISVKGESYSQYIEFKIGRFFDGIDLTKMQLAIYYIIPNVGEDESRPINVYYNENEIKFGWVVPPEVAQVNLTIEFCIYARGKLSDGNDYVLKTKTATYQINDGLEIGSGIIEPTNNWYLNFVLEIDEKVTQASESADRAEQAASSVDGVVETVTTARDEVVQKASTVDTQHSEVESWHQESEQFRNEAEQFRDQAEAIVGIGLAEEGKPGIVQPDGITTKVDADGKLTVIGGGGASEEAIRALEEFTQQLDQDISTLDTELEQTNQQLQSTTDKVDDVQESIEAGFKKQAQGETIRTTDAVDGKVVEFALYGKAEQKQYSGKNLVSDDWEQGILSVDNGTSISSNSYWIHTNKYVEVDSTKQYTISGDTTSSVTIYLYDENKSFLTTLQPLRYAGTPSKTITIPEKTKYVRFGYNYSGDTETITPSQMGVLHWLQFEEGTVATEYEPYSGGIPSPNPSYPQPIEVSGESGSVEVKSCGKNFLQNTLTQKETYGLSYTINNDGSFSLKGTNTHSGVIAFELNRITLKAGTYKVSCFNGQKNKCRLNVYNLADNSIFVQQDDEEKTFTLKEETKIRVSAIAVSGATIDTIGYPMISLDGGEYEPYKETLATIPTENGLAGIKVSSNGNYTDQNGQQWICDEIVKYADGSGAFVQRIENELLTSSLDWLNSKSTVGRYLLELSIKENVAPLCSHFIGGTKIVTTKGIVFNNSGVQICFNTEFKTIEEWKTWIDSNNVYLAYALAEPITTPLTAEEIAEIEKLHTFYPVTNISNDFDCGMEVTYATLQEALMLQEAYNQSRESAQDIVDIKKELSDTTFKVETIIEKADLGIKETASGEEIHLIDSAEGKAVEFALYGKAKQNTTQGNQLFNYDAWKNIAISNGTPVFENNGITITANGDDCYTEYRTNSPNPYPQEAYIHVREGDILTLSWEEGTNKQGRVYIFPNGDTNGNVNTNNNKNKKLSYTVTSGVSFVTFRFGVQYAGDTIAYKNIMINKGSEPLPYEQYSGGMPNPSPHYPQPIEVSGESYNLLENMATSQTINGVEFVVNEDKSITLNGTASESIGNYYLNQENMNLDNMIATCEGINSLSGIYFAINNGTTTFNVFGSKKEVSLSGVMSYARIYVDSGATFNNVTIYPMIRKASVKNDRYMPYEKGSVEVKSCGKNLIESIEKLNWSANGSGTQLEKDDVNKKFIITTNGTSEYSGSFYKITDERIVEKTVTVSCDITISNGSNIYFGIERAKSYSITANQKTRLYLTTTIKKNEGIVVYSGEQVVKTITVENLQIEYGDVVTPFEEYKETLSTIPTENGLCGIKVSSGGNYIDQNGQQWICDEIVKYADGSGEMVNKVRSMTINKNTIKATLEIPSHGRFTVAPSDIVNYGGTRNANLMCSHFTPSVSGNVNECFMANKLIFFNVGIFTVEELTAWFEDKEIKVYYPLAEPIRTPLTAEEITEIEKLSMFNPVTNISNNADCGMRIDYVGDSIITTNTEIPIVEPRDEEELESGDNIVTLFGKIKKKLKNVGKGVVDVVDNLLSTSTTLPLSANQGRVLDEKISTINESLEELGQSLNDISNLINEQLTEQISNISTRLSTLEQNQKTIIYSDTEPETVEENTIVMVYETEE